MLASTSHAASARPSAMARLAALALPGRVHVGLTATEPVRRLSSGVEPIDGVLDGGVPCGRVSEVLGAWSSGKTSLLLALVAATTRRGEITAWVDLADALHPESVADAGVDLHRLLWVRPPSVTDAMRCTELLLQAGGFAVVVLDLGAVMLRPLHNHVWPRLMRAAEQSHTALVVLAPHRVAGSFAVLSLRLRPRALRWQRGTWPLFGGVDTAVVIERNKLGVSEANSVQLKARSQSSGFRLSAFNL